MEDRRVKERWGRIAAFSLITSGIIWWLFSQSSPPGKIDSKAQIKGEFVEDQGLPEKVLGVIQEKGEQFLPQPVKKQLSQIEERLVKKGGRVVEENEVVRQIKTTIQQALEELDRFPEKQRKEIKKELVRQVCNQLLEEN